MEGKKAFSKSYELFIESSKLYSKEGDRESFARTLSRAAVVSYFLVTYCSDRSEIEQLLQKSRDVADKAWKLSKEFGNVQSLAESLRAELNLSWSEAFIVTIRGDERWKEYFRKFLLRCDESLKLAEGYDDPLVIGMIYYAAGACYSVFATQFVEDEREQKEYLDKGLGLMEKALVFARKAKDKSSIIFCLFWLDWLALVGGRFEYLQKRVFDDIHETVELGKIYGGLCNVWRFHANFLPAFYYANSAQRSFFPPDQRKSYAEKGIEHAKESLKTSSFPTYSAWSYQALTWSHMQLAALATAKDERDEHAQKMLQYAKQAAKIGEKYEGGSVRAAGYSSLYRAYKTLADIAENEEERVKMLTAATDAHKKSIGHTVESRTGIIAAQMRLGLLYEELGITAGETDSLRKARETFLSVIKESLERGYHYYAAAAHICVAHIEDRLGNHTASAEHYEKALDAYEESLKTIEYKPLKDRVQEMTSYARAWNLIERAKAYHKREDHAQAKENYEKACEILKQLPSFNYEAPYYSAWALQEEAEQLSKQESHEEAVEKYEMTRKSFDNAIKTLENASKQSIDKRERERIEKLEKVARVRMSYCSARANIERARIMGKQGEHLEAAEIFASAASQFREVFTLFRIERELGELEAVYYLCRAWESMELAEKYEDPDRFAEAANLFIRASNLFTDSKLKLLASGNSAFCQALEHGCKFDESTETQVKAQLYPKVKLMLRKAASSYRKGGFKSGADWALATSTYFDAAWHLIRADEELELDERRRLLGIGSRYLKSAAELFGKTGHRDKKREVLERLDMVEKEEKILVSALNTIREPSISKSTAGIVAPASPVETSLSPRISEVRQLTEEARKVAEERARLRANIQANLTAPEEVTIGEDLKIQLDLVNVAKNFGLIVRIDNLVPKGFKMTEAPPRYAMEAGSIDMGGKRLEPLKVESIKISARATDVGVFDLSPQVIYTDEAGQFRTCRPEAVRVRVHPTLAFRFRTKTAQSVFDYLTKAFVEDYMRRRLPLEKSGWRSLMQIVKNAKTSKSSVYGARGRRGPAMSELERRGLVETRVFPGERGRGGRIVKTRISYEKETVKRHVDKQVMKNKE